MAVPLQTRENLRLHHIKMMMMRRRIQEEDSGGGVRRRSQEEESGGGEGGGKRREKRRRRITFCSGEERARTVACEMTASLTERSKPRTYERPAPKRQRSLSATRARTAVEEGSKAIA